MKSNYRNYFKEGKLYQWDKNRDIFTISKTNIQEEFCLGQKEMDMFLKFNEPEITLGNSLKVKSGNLKADIKICDETLIIPNMKFTSTFTLNVDDLKIANKFVSTSENRPILQGVNVENGVVSATDSFYAYKSKNSLVETGEHNITIASQFIKALTNFKGELEVKCNGNNVACEVEDVIYIGKLLEGNYPSLAKPYKVQNNIIRFDKKELKELLSFSNNKNDMLILENGKITIIGDNNFEADVDITMNCSICLVLSRLLAVIDCIQEEEITIGYESGIKPIYINEDYLALPIKIRED